MADIPVVREVPDIPERQDIPENPENLECLGMQGGGSLLSDIMMTGWQVC